MSEADHIVFKLNRMRGIRAEYNGLGQRIDKDVESIWSIDIYAPSGADRPCMTLLRSRYGEGFCMLKHTATTPRYYYCEEDSCLPMIRCELEELELA